MHIVVKMKINEFAAKNVNKQSAVHTELSQSSSLVNDCSTTHDARWQPTVYLQVHMLSYSCSSFTCKLSATAVCLRYMLQNKQNKENRRPYCRRPDDGVAYLCFLLRSAKLHYTDTGYGHVVQHHQRTSSQQFYNLLYDKFTTNGQNFATFQHLDMSRCWALHGIAIWQICCRIVVSSSVGGVVQHVRSRCPRSGVWHIYSRIPS